MNTENELSQADYARYKGVGRSMVTKWKRDKRLVMNGKLVMVNESDERIKLTANLNNSFNESQAMAARVEVDKAIEEKTFTQLKKEVNETQLDLESKDADELYKNSRALREKASALQAAAEHEKFIGTLVSKEVIERLMFERARSFRDSLLTSARRMSPIVAGKDNINEIEMLLTDEYKSLLVQFAKMPLIE